MRTRVFCCCIPIPLALAAVLGGIAMTALASPGSTRGVTEHVMRWDFG